MKKLLVVLGLLVLVPGLAFAQGTYYVDYYANNQGQNHRNALGQWTDPSDQIIRIVNVGTLGTPLSSPVGDICANIYVFDANQEMIACCSERITPNGLDSAYVGKELTSNPLTSVVPSSGVIKIVLVPPPAGGCSATDSSTTPDATLGKVWGTHLQQEPPGSNHASLYVTETEKQTSILSAAEESFLQTACSYALYLGSGKGTCSSTEGSGQN